MDSVESDAELLRTKGKLKEMATLVIESYGPGILSFLVMFLRDRADAHDAFGQACEDLWKGLPRFEGRSSAKTWFYTIARHAALRQRRSRGNRRMDRLSEISDIAVAVCSRTDPYLQSDVRSNVAAIRAELDEADRVLLLLRVDQEMSWNEIAEVLSEPEVSPEERARAAARLRKRFQLVKQVIYERVREQGLIEKLQTRED